MNSVRMVWWTGWRSGLVSLSYVIGLMMAGVIAGMLGVGTPANGNAVSGLLLILVAGILVGVFLGPQAARLALTGW